MQQQIVPVILSGGSGSRLWPLSREKYPKQFIPLLNEHSLFQNTLKRIPVFENIVSPVIVCNHEYRFMVLEQLRQIGIDTYDILLEPTSRNTAPAISAAAFYIQKKYKNATMLILPADHHLKDAAIFKDCIYLACNNNLTQNSFFTFGVKPTEAHTGYGYIKTGKEISKNIFQVYEFVEKPNKDLAINYLKNGEYYWNSGMFVFSANMYLKELKKFNSDIYNCVQKAVQYSYKDLDFIRLDEDNFSRSPNDSIDYVVMEKSKNILLVPFKSDWSDVGSWKSLLDVSCKDKNGNVLEGDIYSESVENCYIHSHERVIAAVGVKDQIIVETADAIMVANTKDSEKIKNIVVKLKQESRNEAIKHKTIYRPWGLYQELVEGSRFRVRKVYIDCGKSTATQSHYHRSEHWIVLEGTAKIIINDKLTVVTENQSIYIAVGDKHKIMNDGKLPLVMVEVQSGSYLEDNDVERFENEF